MSKHASYVLVALVATFAAAACTSEPSTGQSAALEEHGGICSMFATTAECSAGTLAIVNVSNDDTHLIIRLDAQGGFMLAGADIHAGTEFPATSGGDFDVDAFPFHYDFASPTASTEIRISLADMGMQCYGTLSMAVRIRAVRLDASGAIVETREAFAMSDHAYGSGYCFYYDLCCPMPAPDAGTCDAGTTPETDAGTTPETDAGTPGSACTYTQGYYKNHAEDWPVLSLTIAGEVYTQAELLELYRTPVRGDASIALVHQLATAMLNVENGAPAPAAIADAQAFLAANADADGRLPFGIASSSEASALIDALADFNEGTAGTPHCD